MIRADKLRGVIAEKGYSQSDVAKIIGITPKCNSRVYEIMTYLREHPEIENYCILDDDYDMEELKDNLVKLPPQIEEGQKGLEDIHVDKAIKILKRKKLYQSSYWIILMRWEYEYQIIIIRRNKYKKNI